MSFTAFGPVYKAALALLPPKMDSQEAWAMLYAVALQETRLDARRQIAGPARGFWQFEHSGIVVVLNHPVSGPLIRKVLDRLDYDYIPFTSLAAIADNDVLAFAYARCLLWTIPEPLPKQNETYLGWAQYLEAWNPGVRRIETWPAFFTQAWKLQGVV